MAEPLVLSEPIEGGVIIRLNRAEKRNAVNDALAAAAIAAIDAADADPEVRVIVFTGTGNSFTAGQDMGEASGRAAPSPTLPHGDGGGRTTQQLTLQNPSPNALGEGQGRGPSPGGSGGLSARLGRVEKPIVAAINGFCMGGGTVTALQCDIRICSDRATFKFPGASYGLVVTASLLPAVVGQAQAKDLVFTGRAIDAAEALAMGLVNKVVPHEQLEAVALEYARMIAASSPLAIRHAKRVINAAALDAAAIALERDANRELRGGPDHTARFGAATDRVVGPRA
ncbi:MAG TPA: enoyl-CoA hydratase/isomerase family protein [Dehalococcoidia bacterium]|nr:enoyl-CoA hydratase/isomerase family protein [Dehalococcoidia bacterium]